MKNFSLKFFSLLSMLLLVGSSAFAQRGEVSGIVKDSTGPIAGATVMIDGTTTGTSTNMDGQYTIAVGADQSLSVSYLGYVTQVVPVGTRTTINVTLEEDAEVLDDVVVIGYGTVRRSDVSGSVASVKPDELLSTPSGSVGDMLRGRATGVVVTSSSGRPGDDPSILIRGSRSLSSGDSPLYVIDGVAATSGEFGSMSSTDIASIEILKDAAAQAVYGARAANGVILVTTKHGEEGRARISFDAYASISQAWRSFDYWTPDELYELRSLAVANALVTNIEDADPSSLSALDIYSDEIIRNNYEAGNTTDWESEVLRSSAVSQSYSVNVSQAYDKLKVSIGAGFYDQEGIAKLGSHFTRGNIRTNLNYKVNKWVSLGTNMSYMKSSQDREYGNLSNYIVLLPWANCYDDEGNLVRIADSTESNPVYEASYYQRQITQDRFRVSPYIEIKPWKFLTYKLNTSLYTRARQDNTYSASNDAQTFGTASINTDKDYDYLAENILTFVAPINNKDHQLSVTGVQSWERSVDTALDIDAGTIPVDYDMGWNMLDSGTITAYNRDYSEYILLSFMGRLQYTYKDRYIFTGALRRDGSSRFGENTKWGNFPSMSAAWRVSEESFMQDVDAVSNLKLRLSYGQVGNQNGIGNYETLGTADTYGVEFGSTYVTGYLPSDELTNPNLKWETSTTSNLGVDFGLFKNRITASADIYVTNTTDLIVNQTINSATGYTSMMTNLGETKTRGWEFSVSGDIIKKKDFVWTATLNVSRSVNEIINVNGEKNEDGTYADDLTNNWFVGESINVYYDYVMDGIYQLDDFDWVDGAYSLKPTIDTDGDGVADQALQYSSQSDVRPGYVKLKDLDGDGEITTSDRATYNMDPDFVAALNTTVAYKGFDLFMDFYYSHGGTLLNNYLYASNQGGNLTGDANGIAHDYWTVDNPSNTFPAPSTKSTNKGEIQTCAYQDMTYIRLRTLSLGYTLPKSVVSKLNMQKMRFYVSATNLFTSTDVLSYSPETSTSSYPETQQLVFGLNFEF